MKLAWILPVVVLLPMVPLLPGQGAETALVVAVDPMVKDLEDREGEDFEAVFLAFMIHHHRTGIRMASLAAERGADAQLKSMAEKLIALHTREIEQMEKWLDQWHPRKPGEDMIPQATKDKERESIAELEKAKDERFDTLFEARMVEHHESGIQMARLASSQAIHEEVKSFAAKVVELQAKEKDELRK